MFTFTLFRFLCFLVFFYSPPILEFNSFLFPTAGKPQTEQASKSKSMSKEEGARRKEEGRRKEEDEMRDDLSGVISLSMS